LGIVFMAAVAELEVSPPNIRAKQLSLYTHKLMFTADVAMNLLGPVVTVPAGWARRVDVVVSMAFAVKYVE